MAKNHFLNVRLDDDLNNLVEQVKQEYCINPCNLVRKLLKNAIIELINKGETQNVCK